MSFFKRFQKAPKPKSGCTAVIVAAGCAQRMEGVDKITALLGGEPVITRTIRAFQQCPAIQEIVVVTREELVKKVRAICEQMDFGKVKAVVPGGDSRTASVMRGLDQASPDIRLAAIHDGARPLVTPELVAKTVETAARTGAAAPAVPVKDTIKIASRGVVQSTPDRKTLFAVQTPQVFDFDLLRGALQKVLDTDAAVTDDCSAVEALGMKVHLVPGSEENLKITTPMDLILAQAVLDGREAT